MTAELDVGDVEALADVIRSGYWAAVQHGAAPLYEQARAVLASDWLADLLDAERRKAEAKALREAADFIPAFRDAEQPATYAIRRWLRDRAARLAGRI